jgi:hypothetical protein
VVGCVIDKFVYIGVDSGLERHTPRGVQMYYEIVEMLMRKDGQFSADAERWSNQC